MIDPTAPTLTVEEPSVSGASWGAILAGTFTSLAVTLVVLAFGVGLGLSVVSPWEASGISATTFKISSGIYLLVIAMLSSSLGGYIAGRLRSRWIGVHTDEIYFRDTAHGFVAWAVATVLGVVLLATPASNIIGGAASGALQAGATAGSATEPYLDQLLRTEPAAAPQNTTPSQSGSQQGPSIADSRGELGRLIGPAIQGGGTLSTEDRTYVSKVVASRTGLSQADAEKRVNDVITKAKSDADAARKATAKLAFWLTASLLLGALCASLAATEGGGLRDGTWRKQRV